MNQQKLTHTLKLVLLALLLAAPALGQQSENFTSSDDPQPQVQRRPVFTLDFDRLRPEDRLDFGTDREAKHAQDQNTTWRPALIKTTDAAATTPSQPNQDLSKFAVFVEAGVAIPHRDISIFLDTGFSLNAGLEYMITPQFSAEGIFGYQRFSTFFGGNSNLYQLAGNGKFYFVDESSKVRPFVNGGVGAYITDSATAHFGGNIGGGLLYEATPKFGIQGSYNFHAFSLSNTAKFSTVQGGVRFRF